MKLSTSLLFAVAVPGLLILGAAPAASPAEAQEPPDEKTGGLAQTAEALTSLEGGIPEQSVPRREAMEAYGLGIEHRDRARRLAEEAAAAASGKAVKKTAKAQQLYERAIGQFRLAVELQPEFHQAFGALGHALLATGRHEEALVAYDQALALGPRDPELIEERGEVYLGLDRIEEAKVAYMRLVPFDPRRAAKLMSAMDRWLELRRVDPGEIPAQAIESFARWIEERR